MAIPSPETPVDLLHRIFNARQQETDYKEFVHITTEDAAGILRMAQEFVQGGQGAH